MSDTIDRVTAFIDRWTRSGAAERANYALFLTELCEVLGVEKPHPTVEDDAHNAYVFERRVTFRHADGSVSVGRIDLYRRGCFVLEAKQGSDRRAAEEQPGLFGDAPAAVKRKGTAVRGTRAWDDAMLRARGQAEAYARALPVEEGWPPFLIVVDVGHSFELFADFSRTGKHYTQFPDASSFRIRLDDLADADVRRRLALVWERPLDLDPSRHAARVTRAIADRLARLAKALEAAGHAPQTVAMFLMRCLFTMFAEDVGLLPRDGFRNKLKSFLGRPEKFRPMMASLWATMKTGGFSPVLEEDLLRFNGGLFEDARALDLTDEQLRLLLEAAEADWKDVEPAIFGTLLERALDPRERHKLGAHYTPRAYVERLVMPTVIEPLRADWENAKAAAVAFAAKGDMEAAADEVKAFHRALCETRVLDPACGSGNFLYVTMEHMKRLEGEVLDFLTQELGEEQHVLELDRHTVDPHQFLGIEVNPRAAAIAELVLWIGYLQWHFRTRGRTTPAQPVLKNFKNIECRDAVLAWDRIELVRDEHGRPVTRWDGVTMKKHLVTGEDVPDETARMEVTKYIKPRPAEWPAAEFVVGNPPFIGDKRLREVLGDGYVEALHSAYVHIGQSSDYVMYWWDKAASRLGSGLIKIFGFIATNSISQIFNRRVTARHLGSGLLSVVFAVPDHPWVDASDGADVRISMTVAVRGRREGTLVNDPMGIGGDDQRIRVGYINADLTIGANVASAKPMKANSGLCFTGVRLFGDGFILSSEDAASIGFGTIPGMERVVRPYVSGRDLAHYSRNLMVIDAYGYTEDELRDQFPTAYQWILTRVKPVRDQNRRAGRRQNWWIFGEPIPVVRRAWNDIERYIATLEVSKHKFFTMMPRGILPDGKIVLICVDDFWVMATLSSRVHVVWALSSGGRLGVGNDPVYAKTRCFDPFPFPDATEAQKARIRELGERLDRHRKDRQALHPDLTMTGMYNVLEALRAGRALTDKEKAIHEKGLVSILKQIHDELDAAVFDAYGWPPTLGDEEILERLVALNRERAEEEKRGLIRWLRPEFQAPQAAAPAPVQEELDVAAPAAAPAKGKAAAKAALPKPMAERVQAVRAALSGQGVPVTAAELARTFRGARADAVEEVLRTLVTLGFARAVDGGRYAA